MKNNKLLGALGENLACDYLGSKGYRIIDRNFNCRAGELDIIAMDGDCLAFIEVKCRTGTQYGHPSEAVSFFKQGKLIKAALFYMSKHKLFDHMCRFDVIEILIEDLKENAKINLIKDAFQYNGKYGY